MLALSSILLALCWVAQAAVVQEARQYSAPPNEADVGQGRQLFYLQSIAYPNQIASQLQRLEVSDNPDAQYYSPNQQRQDVQVQSGENISKGSEAPAKLETLEPDAELIPGAQDAQAPPAQVPVSPPSGIPGLLPGQRVYIIHPQHQIYNQNPLYPGLPNGYRPNIQVPGFQRFYIVPAQAGVNDGNFIPQAGYQNTILIDPTGQSYATPQILQPSPYQRLNSPQESNRNYQEASKNFAQPNRQAYQEPAKNYAATTRDYQEPTRNYAEPIRGYQGAQQSGEFVGAQPQFGPAFAGAPTAALPFFGFGRQVELPYHQQGLRDDLQNAVRFSQLISLQPGQLPNAQLQGETQGQTQPAALAASSPSAPPAPANAQGRIGDRDDEYIDEESKKVDSSTEINSSDETLKKTDTKPFESAPEEKMSIEDTKEAMDVDKTARPKAAANIQTITKRF